MIKIITESPIGRRIKLTSVGGFCADRHIDLRILTDSPMAASRKTVRAWELVQL